MESVETLNRLFLTQPPREAYFPILKSAGEGSARAKLLLGLYFIDGYNAFFMDEGLGQKYLEAAYEGGDLPGRVILAKRTAYRDFVTISAAQLQSIQDMANEGDFLAQFALGWMYFSGKWVPNSEELSMEWFRKSAEQGFANAQRWVGSRQFDYSDTDPDWRNKRGSNGIKGLPIRDRSRPRCSWRRNIVSPLINAIARNWRTSGTKKQLNRDVDSPMPVLAMN